jgi:hypothetical protein
VLSAGQLSVHEIPANVRIVSSEHSAGKVSQVLAYCFITEGWIVDPSEEIIESIVENGNLAIGHAKLTLLLSDGLMEVRSPQFVSLIVKGSQPLLFRADFATAP